MKLFKQYIYEKLKVSGNNFKEYNWDEFIDLFKKYGKELYLDELCRETDLHLKPIKVGGWNVEPSYIYVEGDYLVLMSYHYSTDIDVDKPLEDFLDIERLFKGDDIIEKIINYIS